MDHLDFETIGKLAPILAIPGAVIGAYIGNKIHFAEFKTTVLLKLEQLKQWQIKHESGEAECKAYQAAECRRIDDKADGISDRVSRIEGKLNGYLSRPNQ